jgi:hypothetical protein
MAQANPPNPLPMTTTRGASDGEARTGATRRTRAGAADDGWRASPGSAPEGDGEMGDPVGPVRGKASEADWSMGGCRLLATGQA